MSTETADALPLAPKLRGHADEPWAVIVAAVAGVFLLQFFRAPSEDQQIDVFEMQARALVGAGALGANRDDLYKQAKELDRGPASQRLRFVVLAGELKGPESLPALWASTAGLLGSPLGQGPLLAASALIAGRTRPDEALDRLDDLTNLLDKGEIPQTSPEEAQQAIATAEILGRLYRDYKDSDLSAGHVSPEDREALHQRLGWFGDLALNPRPLEGPNPPARAAVLAPAERSMMVEGLVMLAVLGAGVAGFILLVLFVALWRWMHGRITVGSSHGVVYAETFALWLVVYFGLSRAAALLPAGLPLAVVFGLPQLLSLSVLAWPVLRGVSWRQVRQDVGWFAGDRPALEPFFGVLCYLAALPLVILAALAVFAVVRLLQQSGARNLFGPTGAPTHPIVFEVLHSGWSGWLQILFVASVMAPLVEETMFRGVLYRHLREATGRWGWFASVALSALLASFVFAALHPQGWLGIPVLMALALGFTAAREWRGSLLPSMTVHALNNAMVLLLLILMAG